MARFPSGRSPTEGRQFALLVALLSALTFGGVWLWSEPASWPDREIAALPAAPAGPGERVAFTLCAGRVRVDCVVDGDTFWMRGEKIRILDIDTPELSPPRCAEEERRGEAAKARLAELLNAGPVTLARAAGEDDRDRYGRLLRTVHIDGRSVGGTLIAEGLARPYGSGRQGWC